MRILSGLFPILTALGLVTAPLSLEAQTKKPSTTSQKKPAKPSASPQKKSAKTAKSASTKASSSKSSSSSRGSPPKSGAKGPSSAQKERSETVRRAVPLESEPSEPIAVDPPAPPPPPPPPPMIDITHPDFRMPPRKGSPKPHGTRQDPPDRRRTRPLDEPSEIPLPGGGKSSLFALAQENR